MDIINSKRFPFFILIVVSILILNFIVTNSEYSSDDEKISHGFVKDNEKIQIKISIDKEKVIKINNKQVSLSDVGKEVNNIIRLYPKEKKVKAITLHLFVYETIEKGFLTDVTDEIIFNLKNKIQISRKLYSYSKV